MKIQFASSSIIQLHLIRQGSLHYDESVMKQVKTLPCISMHTMAESPQKATLAFLGLVVAERVCGCLNKIFADLSFSKLYACGGKQLQQLQAPVVQTLCVSTQVGTKQLTEAVIWRGGSFCCSCCA